MMRAAKGPLADARGSVDSARLRAASVRERFLPPAARVTSTAARWASVAAWCGIALAQTVAPSHEIALVEGRGELLRFNNDITRVVISEPKVADAVVVSPREVMVNAKGPGRTTLVVWEAGAEPARYEVAVTKDTSEWDAFRKHILESADGSPITVTGTGETI